MNKKVLTFYSIGDWGGMSSTKRLMGRHGGFDEAKDLDSADILVFNGGEDISSSIYNEASAHWGVPDTISRRDQQEIDIFNKYKSDPTKFFFGICRGAQLLNCLNGGSLWQHADKHTVHHDMIDLRTGEKYYTTSLHHQMMRLPERGAELLAIASESTFKKAQGVEKRIELPRDRDISQGEDPEVVWFPATRALCVQGHPEYAPDSKFGEYCLDLVKEFYKESQKRAAV